MKFLKFTSEDQFKDAIKAFTVQTDEGEVLPAYIGNSAIDVVGTIYKPTGKMLKNADGIEYPEMNPIDGWHVNLSGDCPPELQPYVIAAPATPSRVFAGD